jgi:hypothetical protein
MKEDFPTQEASLLSTFLCTAPIAARSRRPCSPQTSPSSTHHIRGHDNLTAYGQSRNITSGKLMTNYFLGPYLDIQSKQGRKMLS